MKKTFLLIPGAWTGKWIWADLKENLEHFGHVVYSITLSGLNSKDENKDFGLQDHVDDIKKFIAENGLSCIS